MNRVFVVLDKNFGLNLATLAKEGSVWIIDTPTNKVAAQQIWKGNADQPQSYVTTFIASDNLSPEDIFVDEMKDIDLHHGKHSVDPPYTTLDVIGIPLTENVQRELAAYGFDQFEGTVHGFRATRSLSAARS